MKLASWPVAAARMRPSTSVMVLSEALMDTDRTSASGADWTEASLVAPAGAAARATSPVTVMPAALSAREKAWAASMAGSAG